MLFAVQVFGQDYTLKEAQIRDGFNTYLLSSSAFVDKDRFVWYATNRDGDFYRFDGKKVYPNPVKAGEKTYIKSKYPIDQIDMFDMTGNLFYSSKNINDYNYSIINQSLPSGTYILKIHSNKVYTIKVVVN